ncbi:hypothetical protein PHYSODRAFT_254629 [Phytophthora sojae]|uniref:Uncharacterized protein n=1 Tax=Phytophthora sojae (strain P6497) TaxID=1094619 RepID=G5A3K5_PHYSP|nr:hypothetical protein PHYSODRAFT_254629 [Phytophthora sojae]EGZ09378.1 hypothetical protein PHYSODRAFT_254629 [Phytophthora sojae]|eukprot:XP_009534239.1 hypothetical protein PHYSODRAFT_254629 [Phytophthora sojae]
MTNVDAIHEATAMPEAADMSDTPAMPATGMPDSDATLEAAGMPDVPDADVMPDAPAMSDSDVMPEAADILDPDVVPEATCEKSRWISPPNPCPADPYQSRMLTRINQADFKCVMAAMDLDHQLSDMSRETKEAEPEVWAELRSDSGLERRLSETRDVWCWVSQV